MKKSALTLLGGVFALIAFAAVSKAQSITIQNGDFTDPTLANGAFTAYTAGAGIPDWVTGSAYAGVQNFAGTGHYATMPTASPNAAFNDGSNIGGAASFYQDLTGDGSLDLLAAGTYTLTAYGGWRFDKSWPGGSISLETSTGDVLGTAALVQPTQGYFALTTLTVPISVANGDIGEQLRVVMTSNGNSTGFDDVALNFAAAPFLGFLGIHRRSLLRS
jgi:hypothetical protein